MPVVKHHTWNSLTVSNLVHGHRIMSPGVHRWEEGCIKLPVHHSASTSTHETGSNNSHQGQFVHVFGLRGCTDTDE